MANHVSPVAPNAAFARVDQGVDYQQRQPYVSPGAGRVYHVGHGFHGGTGQSVYIELDKPIVVHGRSYKQIYVAETTPLVKKGDKVKAGDPVASGGAAELGFANGTSPAAPLIGGFGAGTKQSQEGQDFLLFVNDPGAATTTNQTAPASPQSSPPAVTPPASGVSAAPDTNTEPPQGAGPPAPESTTPLTLAPGSGEILDASLGNSGYISRLWQQIATQPNVSPDTLSYYQNSALAAGG